MKSSAQNMGTVIREEMEMEESIPQENSNNSTTHRGIYLSRRTLVYVVCVFCTIGIILTGSTFFITKWITTHNNLQDAVKETEEYALQHSAIDLRLPGDIEPIFYRINLIPHLDLPSNFLLQGQVWIDVKCLRNTEKITLHVKNLTVETGTISVSEIPTPELQRLEYKIHNYSENSLRNFGTIHVKGLLKKGLMYRIYMQYNGTLDDSLSGFYRSSYYDKAKNETRYIGVTQFEPTDARKAFPCFDEPAYKAKFVISIARKPNYNSISNMDLLKNEPISGGELDGWVWDHFKKSPAMSTYLVAFAVFDFENRTTEQSESPQLRIWARKNIIHFTDYARDIGRTLLAFFEEYFGIPYPLQKLDIIAISDFSEDAMENWGAITIREPLLIHDKSISSDADKLLLAQTISHEISHQWFGNLVTAKWWNDLWLNEGMTTFFEYVGANKTNPDRKVMDDFVTEQIHEAMRLDVLDTSHPLSVPVNDPNEISSIFDCISYSKGASLMRMTNHFLTEETFKKGLHQYLQNWSYKATAQKDLWNALTEQAHVDGMLPLSLSVEEIMSTWTLQSGYPVVKVARTYTAENVSLAFSQQKFHIPNGYETNEDRIDYQRYRWWIPLSWTSKLDATPFQETKPMLWHPKHLMTIETKDVTLDNNTWVILNVQQTGFYRVNYDIHNWNLIRNQLKSSPTTIHTVNRAQIIDDLFNLARADLVTYDIAFNMSVYLKEETEYLPWKAFDGAIDYVLHMMSRSSSYGNFKEYLQELVEKQYKRVGFMESPPETELMRELRVVLIKLACLAENKDCVDRAIQEFSGWMRKADPDRVNPISPNHRRVIYCTAIAHGGQKEWEFLWDRYKRASHDDAMLMGLTCSKDPWLLHRLMTLAITEGSEIRKTYGYLVFSGMVTQEVASTLAFNFIREHWNNMGDYFDPSMSELKEPIKLLATKLTTPMELSTLENFKKEHKSKLGATSRSFSQAIEFTKMNVHWTRNKLSHVSSWLKNFLEQSENKRK